MTSNPASRRARAIALTPRSWPSRPDLATTTRYGRCTAGKLTVVPVAKSDPRRATVVGIVGVVVGSVMILLVLFAGNLGGGDKVKTSSATFDVGPADARAETIAKDQTPLFFPDTATGSHPIVVQHVGADTNKGWV